MAQRVCSGGGIRKGQHLRCRFGLLLLAVAAVSAWRPAWLQDGIAFALAGMPLPGRVRDAQAQRGLAARRAEAGGKRPQGQGTIYVCTSTTCKADGAQGCMKMLQALAPEGVEIRETDCLGPCSAGPNVLATPSPEGGASGGKAVQRRGLPAGYCFTGMKSEQDVALLAPWGFEVEGANGPLAMLRLALRSSQLDQVPWPILLYVGFNVVRLPVNIIFHVDILKAITDIVKH